VSKFAYRGDWPDLSCIETKESSPTYKVSTSGEPDLPQCPADGLPVREFDLVVLVPDGQALAASQCVGHLSVGDVHFNPLSPDGQTEA
jgi:hypothetical protein